MGNVTVKIYHGGVGGVLRDRDGKYRLLERRGVFDEREEAQGRMS